MGYSTNPLHFSHIGAALGATLLLSLLSCSKDKPSAPAESSSSREESSSSSEVFHPDREDVEYADTLSAADSLRWSIPDSTVAPWFLFLDSLPAGTRVRLSGRASGFEDLRISLRRELGTSIPPIEPDSAGDFLYWWTPPSDTSSSVSFPLAQGGYYYLEVRGMVQDSATLVLQTDYDLQRYAPLTSAEVLIWDGGTDSLHGFLPLDQGIREATIRFSSPAGQFLILNSTGTAIGSFTLVDSATEAIVDNGAALRTQLLPQSATTWDLRIRSIQPTFREGHYAFFSIVATTLSLGSGAYIDAADTALRPGDTLRILRPGSENSLLDLRHDHYINLGPLAQGDSLLLWYGTRGLTANQKNLRILRSDGRPVDTLPSILGYYLEGVQANPFRAPAVDTYLLHYSSLNGYFTDSLAISFALLIQKPGLLTQWSLSPASVELHLGDTLHLDSLRIAYTPATASNNTFWKVPRSQRTVVNDPSSIYSEGDLLITPWIVARDTGSAILIAESVADPRRRDTTQIRVLP